MKEMIACVDIGGTSVKTAVCTRDGKIFSKKMYPISDTIELFTMTILSHIHTLQKDYDIEGIAISSCGVVDSVSGKIGGISALPFIHGPNWKKILRDHTGLPCEIENDANCAALSELYFGKAKHVQDLAFMVIGTGIGGAIVKNGKIHHGKHLFGGEFGMMLMRDEEGKLVNYSLLASTMSMVKKMEKLQPGNWDGRRIFEESERGNKDCLLTINAFYHNIAIGVFNIQHMFDPELILFGGAISARKDFIHKVTHAYSDLCALVGFEGLKVELQCCTYLEDANLLGALVNYLQKQYLLPIEKKSLLGIINTFI